MTHISGFERSQLLLLPEAVDDYVSSENPLNLLHRLIDGKAAIPEKIDAPPPKLTLLEEPKGLPLTCTRSTQKPFSSL
jgi:hypothetical protein